MAWLLAGGIDRVPPFSCVWRERGTGPSDADRAIATLDTEETSLASELEATKTASQEASVRLSERETALRAALASAGVDCLELRTDSTLADAITHFMALRKRRSQLAAGTARPPRAA